MLDLYGIGDHGGGPTRAMLDEARPLDGVLAEAGRRPLPTMHYGTAQSYFTDVEQHLNPDSPTWNYDKLAQGWTRAARRLQRETWACPPGATSSTSSTTAASTPRKPSTKPTSATAKSPPSTPKN